MLCVEKGKDRERSKGQQSPLLQKLLARATWEGELRGGTELSQWEVHTHVSDANKG